MQGIPALAKAHGPRRDERGVELHVVEEVMLGEHPGPVLGRLYTNQR
jgi:hypothetical protein